MRYGGLKGYNAIGCRRAGIDQSAIHAIRRAFHCIHSHRTTSAVINAIQQIEGNALPEVRELLHAFTGGKRGMTPSIRYLSRVKDQADHESNE